MPGLRVLALALAVIPGLALAAETPQRGGTLVFALAAEPPTYDCHQANTYAVLDVVSPAYSLLIRFAPGRPGEYEPDLAESWEVAADGLAYTFHLHPTVRFHDGSPLTASDVKASFERIKTPPQGVISQRKAVLDAVASIETPDPRTVVLRLKEVDAALLNNLASPWSCIYSARLLDRDPKSPERTIMGTGPFAFAEHVPGSHFLGRRFDGYFMEGRPYLDAYRAVFVSGAAMVNSLAGGQVMAEFRGLGPAERDRIVAARGDRIRILESDFWMQLMQVTLNVRKPPLDDARVRRALALGIDRWGNSAAVARTTFMGPVSGFLPPGSEWRLEPGALEKHPGYGRDIAAARNEARRLLREAGVPDLKLRVVNRTQLSPYTEFGVFLIDQWRQIGVTAEHVLVETAAWQNARNSGSFDALVEVVAEHSDDPSTWLVHYISTSRSPINYSGSSDARIDALFDRQRATLDRAERRRLVQEMDGLLLDQAAFLPAFWSKRIIPLTAELRGWHMFPSHFLGQDLRDVWLAR
jgi:peptide/nickel transport system substrate-binding protein